MSEKIQITVIATGFSSEKEKRTMSNISSKYTMPKQKPSGVILEEAEVLPVQDEDMFSISGVPKNPYDIPSIIRRNKKSS